MQTYHMGVYQPMYTQVTKKWDDLYTQYKDDPVPVQKINIYHTSPEARQRTRKRIIENGIDVEITNAETTSLEITAKGIHKAVGLEKICQYLNISMSDVIVVGDADNDKEALRKAGLAVAMGNAKANIKELSDIIVEDNDHDGCAKLIQRYLLKKII